ncbi:hypothetical protein CROQUDRAFT_32645, partial [Cronartium quercuum f. sp. fusiforme G11]
MDDFEQLERLSLVNSITKELYNHVGLQDSTLAEFLISLHEESSSLEDFKSKLGGVGAEFPESFITNMDRLVLSLHPKYKKKTQPAGNGKEKDREVEANSGSQPDEKKRRDRALFPGLAIPDVPWQPSYVPDPKGEKASMNLSEQSVDDLMNELEGVEKKKKALQAVPEEEEPEEDHRRRGRGRSLSPSRARRRSPGRSTGRNDQEMERGRSGYRIRDDGYKGRVDDVRDSRRGANQPDPKPVLFKIYEGTVSSVKDYGCFVSLEGLVDRADGMVHVNSISSARVNHPTDLLSRNQRVKVKVMSIVGNRLALSMKDVDQATGADLSPQLRIKSEAEMAEEAAKYAARHATGANSTLSSKTFADDHRSSARRLTSPERWEIKQMIASGAASAADYPNLDDDLILPGSTTGMAAAAQAEEELDVEIREDEAPFLKGAHRRVLDLSPVKIVKAPDGTLNR